MSDPVMRGGSGISIGRDANRVPATFGVSSVDGETPVPIEVTPAGALLTDASGSIVIPQGNRTAISPITQLTLSSTTAETTLIAATATTFNDLLCIVAINTSASATQVDFRDSTGGTIRLSLYLPAGDTRGVVFSVPMPQATVNNNWTAQCGNSVNAVIITGSYIGNK